MNHLVFLREFLSISSLVEIHCYSIRFKYCDNFLFSGFGLGCGGDRTEPRIGGLCSPFLCTLKLDPGHRAVSLWRKYI